MVRKTSKKWETITKSVRVLVLQQNGSEEIDGSKYAWSFKWGSSLLSIQRDAGNDSTMISSASGLAGDDLAYYQKIGGHDWRVIMRMLNAQLGRTEIGFLAGSAPGFVLYDTLYDDAFTKDELFRRVRTIALTDLFLRASMKLGKTKAGMRGAEPIDPSDIDVSFYTDEDLQADRLKPELAGGQLGPYTFRTTEGLIGSIILSVMATLEHDYGSVLDTKFVIDHIVEMHNLPVTLLRETINHLKMIGALIEVEEERIKRVE